MLTVQPTPAPWSARQAQMWSMMVLLLLTTRLVVALPATGAADPEEHVLDRDRVRGVAGGRAGRPDLQQRPASSSCPASNSRPAIFTPSTSATVIARDAVVRDQGRRSPSRARPCRPG